MMIRPATSADAEGIFRVLSSAFRLEAATSRWHHMRQLAFEDTGQFLVLAGDGEVTGTALVRPQRLRVGAASVLKGDVGEVAVLPERQGQGLGTELMRGCVRFLKMQGCHLSRLGGLNRFYARFGYVPFPRRFYEFLLTDVRAGASVIPPDRLTALTPEEEQCVRPYHPSRDWQQRGRINRRFNENRTGSLVSEEPGKPEEGEPDPAGLSWVYERDGALQGYLTAVCYPEEPSPFEARLTVGEVAFDPDCPQALTALLRYALREALRRGIHRVTARLPFDPIIQTCLTDASLRFSLQELQSGVASNMLLLVDLEGLLRAILPELTRRRLTAALSPPFAVRWRVGGQEATMAVREASVEIAGQDRAEAELRCDPVSFLRWLLGLNSFSEWQAGVSHTLTAEQARLMACLWPREPSASGPWG